MELKIMILIILCLLQSIICTEDDDLNDCSIYLAPSKHFPGRGIITSKSLESGTIIDYSAITLPVPLAKISTWQLNNYVYASEEDYYAMCIFGMAMIFNHMNDEYYNAHHYWDISENIPKISDILMIPYSNYTSVSYSIRENFTVESGNEIFASYGDASWFLERNIQQIDIKSNDIVLYKEEELKKVGHCLSNVMIFDSDIPLAGKGLFAYKNFKKDDIVDISPVLILRKHEVESISNESVIMNYVITSKNIDVVLLPLGLSAAINHNSESLANLQMEWYEWSTNSHDNLNKYSNIEDLLKSEFSPLDVSFRAKRDISYGEELTINYGIEWVEAWASYLAVNYQQHNDITTPFRHPIIAPNDFFPKHWYVNSNDEL